MKTATIIFFSVAVFHTIYAGEQEIHLAIFDKKDTYQKWLIQQRPILTKLQESIIQRVEFTTYDADSTISPVFTYYLKAGDWDGILEVWFTLKVDSKLDPVGFREETVTFLRLPAKMSVPAEEGRRRNQYYGLHLDSKESTAAIRRVIVGDDFDDYRKKVDESGAMILSTFADTDDWATLRKGEIPAQPSAVAQKRGHYHAKDSTHVDDFELIAKNDLFIGTTKNLLPAHYQYLLKGKNGYLQFKYDNDYNWEKLDGKWRGKTLNYDKHSRTVSWRLYNLALKMVESGSTRISFGGWEPNPKIPFKEIDAITGFQPSVHAGEFDLWNEVYDRYAWVTFKGKNRKSSLSIAVLPETKSLTHSLIRSLAFHDIEH